MMPQQHRRYIEQVGKQHAAQCKVAEKYNRILIPLLYPVVIPLSAVTVNRKKIIQL